MLYQFGNAYVDIQKIVGMLFPEQLDYQYVYVLMVGGGSLVISNENGIKLLDLLKRWNRVQEEVKA